MNVDDDIDDDYTIKAGPKGESGIFHSDSNVLRSQEEIEFKLKEAFDMYSKAVPVTKSNRAWCVVEALQWVLKRRDDLNIHEI